MNCDVLVLVFIEMLMLMKVELVELLFDSVGLNKCEVKDMVEVFFEVICDVFENGESVKLLGFGNF